jgi:peptidoglycan/xylan/chitin deacetylase (PgdA/CDA1 family)
MALGTLTHRALKPLWAAADSVTGSGTRTGAGLVILLYHRVGAGTASEVDLPTAVFREQCAELAGSGRVVSLDDGLAWLAGDHPSPGGSAPLVITFDDGTADFVDHALPELVAHRLPATLYAATRWLEEDTPFWGDGPALSWGALAEAAATGLVNVGSHTHNHVLLDRLDPANVAGELDRSIELIGSHLGRAPVDFAYPKALAPSTAAAAAVRSRFRSAALAGTRANRPGVADLHRLRRSPIQVSDGMQWWRRKVNGGMGAEDRARERLNELRYRGRAR